MDISNHSHKRYNPLSDEWILVSPHRRQRPWQGQEEDNSTPERAPHDPTCYLCRGVQRASGEVNPQYTSTYVFTNDFSALLPPVEENGNLDETPLFMSRAESGICRVICFSPRHDLTIARMDVHSIAEVVQTWQQEYADLGSKEYIGHVQIFENKGESMGCSNPHPHGQIWATESVPSLVARELTAQHTYMMQHNSCLLCDYLKEELQRAERIIYTNASFTALVPYWAVWPFEVMIVANSHFGSLSDCTPEQLHDLAACMKNVTVRYDNLFATSFPYSMGLHQQPTDNKSYPHHHFHMHYYPPLLRSATIKKFMVGFEMLGMAQRDLTPEEAAQRLRELPQTHYLEK